MSEGLRVAVATGAEIAGSRNAWNRLVSMMRFPSVFLTWEWVTTWISYFGECYRLYVLFVKGRDNEPVAILPMALRTVRLPNGWPRTRTLALCGTLELFPDHLDLICNPADFEPSIKLIREFFENNRDRWDVIQFGYLAEEGLLARFLGAGNFGSGVRRVERTPAPFVRRERSIAEYMARFGSKTRYNLNREKKTLFEKFGVTFERARTQGDVDTGMGALFDLHGARIADKGIRSTFSGEKIREFHRSIAKTFFELGWLRLYFLRKDQLVISVAYGFLFKDRFYYYQTGFDPLWKKYSVGKLLILRIIEDLYVEGTLEFDFLGGEDDYKNFWAQDRRYLVTHQIFGRTGAGTLAKIGYLARETLKKAARAAVPVLRSL